MLRINSVVVFPVNVFSLRCSWTRLTPTASAKSSTLNVESSRFSLIAFINRSIKYSSLAFTSIVFIFSSTSWSIPKRPFKRILPVIRFSQIRSNSSIWKGLARKASAPTFQPLRRLSYSVCEVKRTKGIWLIFAFPLVLFSSSNPSISGITTSEIIKSTRWLKAIW